MRDEHVVARSKNGEYRASIVLDEDPHEPCDDGGSPILCCGDYAVTQVGGTSYKIDQQLIEALERFGPGKTFRRYARIFHGATNFVEYGPNRATDDTYITLDPAHWREAVGAPEGSANLDEWIAHVEGEVYGYVIEARHRTERRLFTLNGVLVSAEVGESWETLDSCWGFYGYGEFVIEAAREALGFEVGAEEVEVA